MRVELTGYMVRLSALCSEVSRLMPRHQVSVNLLISSSDPKYLDMVDKLTSLPDLDMNTESVIALNATSERFFCAVTVKRPNKPDSNIIRVADDAELAVYRAVIAAFQTVLYPPEVVSNSEGN